MPVSLRGYYQDILVRYFKYHALISLSFFLVHFLFFYDVVENWEVVVHIGLLTSFLIIFIITSFPRIYYNYPKLFYVLQLSLNTAGLTYLIYTNILNKFPCEEFIFLSVYTLGVISFPRRNKEASTIYFLSVLVVIGGLLFIDEVTCIGNKLLVMAVYVGGGFLPFFGVYFFNKIAFKLNEARKFVETLFENYYDAILEVDPFTKRIKNCNQAAVQLLGYSSKDELCRLFLEDIGFDLKSEEESLEFRKAIASQGYFRKRIKIKKGKGEWFWVDFACIPFSYSKKEVFIIRISDVTEWVFAEEELKKSETFHRTLFELSPAGIFRSTLDGTLLLCNSAFAKMFGYDSPKEIINNEVKQFYVNYEDRNKMIEKLLKDGEVRNFKVQLIKRNGQVFAGLVNAQIAEYDGKKFLEGEVVDISPYEEQLSIAEQKIREFEVMFGKIGIGTYKATYSPNSKRIDYLSSNTVDIFGFTPEERISGKIQPKDYFLPEDLEKISEGIKKLEEMRHQALSLRFVYRIRHLKTKEIKWIEETRISIKNDVTGEFINYGMVRDITYLNPKEAYWEIIT